MMLSEASSPFCKPDKINKYGKHEANIPCGSRVLTTTQRTDAQQTVVHPKRLLHMPWLDNVDMHLYAKCDENMPFCSRIMTFSLTANGRTLRCRPKGRAVQSQQFMSTVYISHSQDFVSLL